MENIWKFRNKTLRNLKKEEKLVEKELNKLSLIEDKLNTREQELEFKYLKQFFYNKYQLLRYLIYGDKIESNNEWNEIVDEVKKNGI